MSLVVADDGAGVTALVASGGAIDEVVDGRSQTLAVLVHEPGIASAFCLAAAGAWRAAEGERLASAPDRLDRVAGVLSAHQPAETSSTGLRARVVLDRDHDVLLAQMLRSAQDRLVLASAQPSAVAPPRLVELLSRPREKRLVVSLVVGADPVDVALANQLSGLLTAVGGQMRKAPGVARGFVADDRAVVGSFDPLATEPYDASRGIRHVSIDLHGRQAADTLAVLLAR